LSSLGPNANKINFNGVEDLEPLEAFKELKNIAFDPQKLKEIYFGPS